MRISRCKKGTRSVAEYIREFKLLNDQLKALGKGASEPILVTRLLGGLTQEHEPVKSAIHLELEKMTFERAVVQLQAIELRSQEYQVNTSVNQNFAFFTQGRVKGRSYIGQRGGRFMPRGCGTTYLSREGGFN